MELSIAPGAADGARRAGLRRPAARRGGSTAATYGGCSTGSGLIQIDSVNVLVRSQELPLFARLGPHPRDLLPKMLDAGELFEYWAHEASLLPIETLPWFRWTMDAKFIRWPGLRRMAEEHPDVVERVHAVVTERGPIAPSDIAEREGRSGPWWGWDNTQAGVRGAVRLRDDLGPPPLELRARVRPAPSHAADRARRDARALRARRATRRWSSGRPRSLGVGDGRATSCDYFRLNVPRTRPVVAELVEEGHAPAGDRRGLDGNRRSCTPTPACRAGSARARCCRRSTR